MKNYKRLEDSADDANFAKAEFTRVLNNSKEDVIEKFKQSLIQTYHDTITEIERRKLAERGDCTCPRIEFFVFTIFEYSFEKLHKGDRIRAYELLEELKEGVLFPKMMSINKSKDLG